MTIPLKIVVLVGSARTGSINRTLALALERLAEGRMRFDYPPIATLPLYNGDLETDPPEVLWDIKARIEAADGVLFVTPEHNRSIPALIKNAIDWASRPNRRNSWKGKRAAVCGASPGARGADMAQMHLRQIVVPLGVEMMPQPEAYTPWREGLIDPDGHFADEADAKRHQRFLDAFADWVGLQ